MCFDIKNITGKIIIDSNIIGTGFLLTYDIFVTAFHNIHNAVNGIPEEKEVIIDINEERVKGCTLNLKEAYIKGIDIVFIKLHNSILNVKLTKVIKIPHFPENYSFETYGYPQGSSKGFYLKGKILFNKMEDSIILNLDEEFFLDSYKGLSGSPIIVDNFIIGIVIAQVNQRKIFGISFTYIENTLQNLPSEVFPLKEKEIKNFPKTTINYSEKELNFKFFQEHINEALNIAGPRYSKKLNIKNPTFNILKVFSEEYDFSDDFNEYIQEIPFKLNNLISPNNNGAFEFEKNSIFKLNKITEVFDKIITKLKEIIINNNINKENIDYLYKTSENLNITLKTLNEIYNFEFDRFEKHFGKGYFENKSWRGFEASYNCKFPPFNLDTLHDLINLTYKLEEILKDNKFEVYFSKNLLLIGKGGIGKTHSLCDIINENINNDIPSLLFFGQYFRDTSPEKIIIDKLSLNGLCFDEILYKLNNIGYRINKKILIGIDAINETNDKNYWNNYFPAFIEKIKIYPYLKLIISCRSIYLDEILNEDISNKFLTKEHSGFEKMDIIASNEYFKYYNLNIPLANTLQKEFSNPLFLKLYCELSLETSDINYSIENLTLLLNHFFKVKNKKISNKFSEDISPKDEIINTCVFEITKSMLKNKINYLEWSEIRSIVANILSSKIGIGSILTPKLILDELISENILKENDIVETSYSFAFERFFDYLNAINILEFGNDLNKKINFMLENISIYKGTLEILMILYKEKFNIELFEVLDKKDDILYEIFLLSLTWRKNKDIDKNAISLFEFCIKYSKNKRITELSLFTLLELSLKKDCLLNANYFHSLFKNQRINNRDYFLGYWLMKSYKKYDVLNKIIDTPLYLKEKAVDITLIELWEIILTWLTSLNDIFIRDKASKALTNLFKLYPETIFHIINKFNLIDDDYIYERIWGAIYASLILNRDEVILKKIIKYIYNTFILENSFPENVLLRDFLRNIAELAKNLNKLEYDISLFRPPYKSKNIEKIFIDLEEIPSLNRKLFFNCTESDFGIYTIPDNVTNYGFTKKDVGMLIYKEILENNLYDKNIINFDVDIDSTYGSDRNRDESVERISKKYQNIYLKKILGRIYDNYISEKYSKEIEELDILPEQGNEFRTIDLTCLPYETLEFTLKTNLLNYNFDNFNKYKTWFLKDDILFLTKKSLKITEDNFILMAGNFNFNNNFSKSEKYPLQNLWFEVRSYLIKIEDSPAFEKWLTDKHFWNHWMPEGYNSLYEGWLGEYPWSPTYKNILNLNEDEQRIPFKVIPTSNNFNNEKDSTFCQSEIEKHFKFPSEFFFKHFELIWNGQNIYSNNSNNFFILDNDKIYINKILLDKFLKENNYTIVWTILGEKRVILKNMKFLGNAEFSQTFKYYHENVELNHYYYKTMDENYNENIKIIFPESK